MPFLNLFCICILPQPNSPVKDSVMILSRALINDTIILFSNQDPESALWETSWVHFRMEDADPNPGGKNPGKFAEKVLKT